MPLLMIVHCRASTPLTSQLPKQELLLHEYRLCFRLATEYRTKHEAKALEQFYRCINPQSAGWTCTGIYQVPDVTNKN